MATWKRLLTEEDLGSVGTGNDTNFANTDLNIGDARTHTLGRQTFTINQGGVDTGNILRLEAPDGSGDNMSVELRGEISIKPDTTNNAVLRLHNTNGNFTQIKHSPSGTTDILLTLPPGNPPNGRYLRHSSGGQLEWATVTAGSNDNIGNSDFTIDAPTVRTIDGSGTLSFEIDDFQTNNLRVRNNTVNSGRVILEGADGVNGTVNNNNLVLAAAIPHTAAGSIGYGIGGPYENPGFASRAPMMFVPPLDDALNPAVHTEGNTIGSLLPLLPDNLPDYSSIATAAGFDSIGEYLADTSTATPCFMVNDAINKATKKLTLDDISAHLLIGLVNANIANGVGDEGTYTDSGSGNPGLLADFNGDGSVTTADLLEFLIAFGMSDSDVEDDEDTYTVRSINIDDASDTDLSDGTVGSPNKLRFQLTDVTSTNGSLDVVINAGDDEITIQNDSFFNMNSLPAKKLKFFNNNSGGVDGGITVKPASSGGTITLFAKIKIFKFNGDQIGTEGLAPLSVFDNSSPIPENGEIKIFVGGESSTSSYVVTSQWLFDNCGAFFSNTDIQKVQFSFFLQASDVVVNSASIDGIKVKLTSS